MLRSHVDLQYRHLVRFLAIYFSVHDLSEKIKTLTKFNECKRGRDPYIIYSPTVKRDSGKT